MTKRIAFIGGGNMASAIIGGLIGQGFEPEDIDVVEPFAEAQNNLETIYGVLAQTQPGPFLTQADMVIWAVKPQILKEATLQVRAHTPKALHLSIAAGIRSDSIAGWLGSERVARAMPNTPALIGKGITALFARPGVTAQDKEWVGQVMTTTGEFLWLDHEENLDVVTAISGSGPAYTFYFMEAMADAGTEMGLTRAQAYQLAVATFIGAGELARASKETPEILRQRVTSQGGTTQAAIASMDKDNIKTHFIEAMRVARQRAKELGDEFGGV